MNDNGHYVDHIDHKRTPIIAETAAPSQRYPPFRLMLNLAYHGTHNYYLILHALNCLFVQVLVYSCNQYRENGILQINSGGTNLWKPMLLRHCRKSNVFYDTRTCAYTLHETCQTIELLNCKKKCRHSKKKILWWHSQVLDHSIDEVGVGTSRQWAAIGCDGLPYVLASRTIE